MFELKTSQLEKNIKIKTLDIKWVIKFIRIEEKKLLYQGKERKSIDLLVGEQLDQLTGRFFLID